MYELIAKIVMQFIGIFISKAEEKAAWDKAIKARLRELDATSNEAPKLRDNYDAAMQRLKDRQNGTVPKQGN